MLGSVRHRPTPLAFPNSFSTHWCEDSVGDGSIFIASGWPAKAMDHMGKTDRGKSGSKRHLFVDRSGVPLAVRHSAANVHDSRMLETMLDAVSSIRRPRGRPRKRPEKLHADKAYDSDRCREALRKRGIAPRIARRRLHSSERLGRHRWVAERTLAWLNRYRRLKVRYERLADVHQAFLSLGCALVCWNFVQRAC